MYRNRLGSLAFGAGVASQVVRGEISHWGVVAGVLPDVLEHAIVVDAVESVVGGYRRHCEQCHGEAGEGLHAGLSSWTLTGLFPKTDGWFGLGSVTQADGGQKARKSFVQV